jgi:beta-galactosidase
MNKALTIIGSLLFSMGLFAQTTTSAFPKKDLLSVGVYYYPEHWNPSQWERDIKKIADMGFQFIHLAEFAWIDMEPQEGKYEFGWLDEVIAIAEKHDLKVVLCTPTITPPVWLGEKYPEIYLMNVQYTRQEHGTRAMNSLNNDIYRKYCANIITQIAKHFANNKNVIGWQLDNEPEAKADYSPSAQNAFRKWLQQKYTRIETLNTAWGTAFWSQRYSQFDQVKIPNAPLVGWWGTNPHALLDYNRFLADVQGDFLNMQADLLRQHIPAGQFITTNYLSTGTQADPRRATKLDFASYTAYPNNGSANIGELGFRLGNPQVMTFANDYYRSVNGFTGVMELQPGQVNWADINAQPLPGTIRMWLYHCYASGSSFACTYRFRQINYSSEQYHSGIIKSDGVTPSQGGLEFELVIKEMNELKKHYQPNAQMPEKLARMKTALIWNNDNIWSMQRQSQSTQWNAMAHFQKYHEMTKSLGAPTDIVSEDDDLSTYPFAIAPAYELLDSALVQKWVTYVTNGGHLILTPRTGVKNRWGHIWEAKWAAPIYPLINAQIEYFDQLPPSGKAEVTMNDKKYAWNNWGDIITPNDAKEVLAIYSDQFYSGKAAAIRHKTGKGTVTYIGVDTDDAQLEREIVQGVYQQTGAQTENHPQGVYVQWRDGYWIAVNFSSTAQTIRIPAKSRLLIGNNILQPAGVAVWME